MVNRGTWRPEKFTQGQLDDALQLLQQESSRSEQKVADRDNILSKMGENRAFLLKNDIKQPLSLSSEVLRGLRSSPKVHCMPIYNFCTKGVLGQNKKWVAGAIFCQKHTEKRHPACTFCTAAPNKHHRLSDFLFFIQLCIKCFIPGSLEERLAHVPPLPHPIQCLGHFAHSCHKTAGVRVIKSTWEPEKLTQGALDDALQLLHEGSSRSEQKVADWKNILSKLTEKGHFCSKKTENCPSPGQPRYLEA